jgi:non-ribosomal peptide synthetase component F
MKAGGAFVLLDPLVPEQRLQGVMSQLKADLIVCSPENGALGARLACTRIIEVIRQMQDHFVESLPHQTYPLMMINEQMRVDSPGLFNSAISFTRIDEMTTHAHGHILRADQGSVQTEVGSVPYN